MARDTTRCSEIFVFGHGLGGVVALLHRLELVNLTRVQLKSHTFGAPPIFRDLVPSDDFDSDKRYYLHDHTTRKCGDPIIKLP